MFNAIENFHFENRFQTRSEATVELIRLGLEQLKRDAEEKKLKKMSPIKKMPDEKFSNGENAGTSEFKIIGFKQITDFMQNDNDIGFLSGSESMPLYIHVVAC